jgi:beta-glucanase (GH16 family)
LEPIVQLSSHNLYLQSVTILPVNCQKIRIPNPYPDMHYALSFLLLILLACVTRESVPPPGLTTAPPDTLAPSAYTKLVWSDEFNGSQIDRSKWEHEVNDKGGGNNELQFYTAEPANSYLKNGNLVIEARKETYQTRQYTSARMRTRNRGDWKFGKIEVRAKIPKGQGIWPAIWMLPTDEVYGGWPRSGEIDIMEIVGHEPHKLYGTVHFGPAWPDNKMKGDTLVRTTGTYADDFHVYSIVWDKDMIRWYLDGRKYFSVQPADLAPQRYPFNERFHLILNVAVGGNWPGNPDSTTVFPQHMLVDYVRVYQRE